MTDREYAMYLRKRTKEQFSVSIPGEPEEVESLRKRVAELEALAGESRREWRIAFKYPNGQEDYFPQTFKLANGEEDHSPNINVVIESYRANYPGYSDFRVQTRRATEWEDVVPE